MSIVLVGSTSGSVTLQEPAIAGSTVLTLPAVSGTVLTTTSPKAGNVIQVVQATYATQTSTTASSTYVDTGLSASITPSSSSSKILVCGTIPMRRGSGSVFGAGLRIVRNSTSVSVVSTGLFYSNTTSTDLSDTIPFSYLDSPATTSSTTYKLQMNCQAGLPTIFAQVDNDASVIILMEIAG